MKWLICLATLFAVYQVSGQDTYPANPYKPTSAKERIASSAEKAGLKRASFTRGLDWVNIGPTIMSGRVTDVDVDPENAGHFYVAYASGGVWESTNNGTTFEPVFDNNGYTLTVGDIAVNWKTKEIWVGTGEENSSRSSYAGYGVFYSADSGKTWEHKGLEESHHISKILIDPASGAVYVAALGHLYSPNPERGVYRSKDGGNSWEKILYVNENTGIIDLVQDPNRPGILYAAAWEKSRRAWNFWESGSGTGIYKSVDGGNSWQKVTISGSGFPDSENSGRIGLSLYSDREKSVLYALLDNQSRFTKDEQEDGVMNKKEFLGMDKATFLELSDSVLAMFLKENGFPEKYTAKTVKKMVRKDEIKPEALYTYLTDANAALFDDPVRGAELYRSLDGGQTWEKTHDDILENVVYSYGYYFGTVHVDPGSPDRVYIAGVPLLLSVNGGQTFSFAGGDNVHVDHHVLWVNPANPAHLINGNDGGINISYDFGTSWIKCNTPAVGQFYTVTAGQGKNYHVYGGLQDNGTWMGPYNYRHSTAWHQTGSYPYRLLNGGDGMQVQVDQEDDFVYTGYQFGHYTRIHMPTGKRLVIHPHHDLGEQPFRWNWQTPIWLSKHNNKILYMGSNRFHRSLDQGNSFQTLSEDLTLGGKKGDVSFGTLTTIHESPVEFGLIVTGSDDGLVHVSDDGGKTWTNVSRGLPPNLWVSRAIYSAHSRNRLYVALNGYRWDYFESMLYVSEDNGKSWNRVAKNLPLEPINVIREDPSNENLLYAGTDNGVFVSSDRGKTFTPLGNNVPPVAVHDIAIHDEMGHCIIGTHGRSLYRLDINLIRMMDTLKSEGLVHDPKPVNHHKDWGDQQFNWSYAEPEVSIGYIIAKKGFTGDSVTINIVDSQDHILYKLKQFSYFGPNMFNYNLTIDQFVGESLNLKPGDNGQYYLVPGKYRIIIRVSEDLKLEGALIVKKT